MQNPAPAPSLAGISQAHADIIAHLFQLTSLGGPGPLDHEARTVVERSIAFFEHEVLAHHHAEEMHLFPTVLSLALDETERDYVQTLVTTLTEEHRKIEALWASLAASLQTLLAGNPLQSLDARVQELALDYGDHATQEESEFLPLCQEILRRAHPQRSHDELLHSDLSLGRSA